MLSGYAKGIKVARLAIENAEKDFKATIERIQEACRWKRGVAESWYTRREIICGNLIEEAEQALKEAEAREEAEAKVRTMEDQCEELANLTRQAGKQIPAEAEPELLIELEEEMEQSKETVEDLGRALKETLPAEFKERAEQAVQESAKIVEEGKRYVEHIRARLEFISGDSESGSYKGPTERGAAARPWRQPVEEPVEVTRTAETSKGGSRRLGKHPMRVG
jgi:myosin heavy subunit